MTKKSMDKQNPEIRDFILRNVEDHPSEITSLAVKTFGISRQAISKYLKRLVAEGYLTAEGKTKARKYKLGSLTDLVFTITLSRDLPEDAIWRFRILPKIKEIPENILNICHYGFTEILNNAIDHSASKTATIKFLETYAGVEIRIFDSGIGIFEKIRRDFNLPDAQSALLELSKGKLTSDKTRHSGEGIFFTSRMFDEFKILSGLLYYSRTRAEGDEWLIEARDEKQFVQGTQVFMKISKGATWTTREIFNQFQGDSVRFRRTHVPIKLGKYPGEQLVSRSQAKRILARFENFSEVFLDFEGVETIGQPFADEIFRVFKNSHPEIKIITVRASDEIDKMISFVQAAELL